MLQYHTITSRLGITGNSQPVSRVVQRLFCVTLAAVCPLCLSSPSCAESLDRDFSAAHTGFFNLLYYGTPDVSGKALYRPDNDEDGGPGSFDLQQYSFTSELANPLTRDDYLRFGFDYDLRIYDFKRMETGRTQANSEALHGFSFAFGAGTFITDSLLITGTFEPGMYSDLDSVIDGGDIQLYGRGVAVYQLNPGAQVLGGLMYDETFDDKPLLPMLGVRLQSDEGRVHLNLTFPVQGKVSYALERNFIVYGGYFLSGDEFRVGLDEAEAFRIHVEDRLIGLGLSYYFSESVGISGEAGSSVGSKLNFKTPNAGQFDDSELEPAFYLSISLDGNL